MKWSVVALLAALGADGPAGAGEVDANADARGAFVKSCIDEAARLYAIPPDALLIVLSVENGRLGAVSQNRNNTVDIGPMQVNQIWLPKLAAHWRASQEATYLALRDEFCANIEGGAWILRQAIDEAKGDLWEGLGLYHSHNESHKTEYLRAALSHGQKLRQKALAASPLADARGIAP